MVLTRPEPASGLPLREVVRSSLEAGATAIQLRHKGASARAMLARAGWNLGGQEDAPPQD